MSRLNQSRTTDGSAQASRLSARVWLVILHGDHDLSSNLELETTLALCGASGALVIDLTDATFLDTSTLAVLIHRDQAARAAGGVVVFAVGSGGCAERLFHITGLDRLLSIQHTRSEALDAIPAAYQAA